jgi:hypothetical protein
MRFIRSHSLIQPSLFGSSPRLSTKLFSSAFGVLLAWQAQAYDWLQFNGDPQHSGNNTSETTLSAANVAGLTVKYQATLPAISDGSPVFIDGVTTALGVKDLLFVTTKLGHIVALDAHSGAQIWMKQYANSAAGCDNGECTNSTPVIDPNRQFVYTYGLDGYVHKLLVGDGTEITTGGWPQLSTLKPSAEKQSAALALASSGGTTYLYSAISAHNGDGGDNQGHVTSINLGTGTQTVFNMVCSDQSVHLALKPATPNCSSVLAGSWARPGVVYDAGTDRLFVGTGNGHFNVASNLWGDSIVALKPYGIGNSAAPVDSYTPTNQLALDNGDTDLGSTAPAILPVKSTSAVQHLAVQSGKDGQLRLLNLANLSGAGGPGNLGGEVGSIIAVPQGGAVRTQPATWINPVDSSTWVFVVNTSGASGLKLGYDANNNPSLSSQWKNTQGSASPLVANNVLYYAGSAKLVALNPATGAQLFSTTQIGSIHWQTPVVACAKLYVLDQSSKLNAFGLALNRTMVAGGNDQSTLVGSDYASAPSVLVTDASGTPQSGATVTFQLPASGASGTFTGGATSATAITNASGIANAPALSANSIPGSFIATATSANSECAASFHLTNTAKFVPLPPARILETRSGLSTIDGLANAAGALGNNGVLNLSVLGRGGVPVSAVSAVVLNVTVTNPLNPGYLTVWPSGAANPNASNINFVAGQTVPNLVVSKVGSNGQISLLNGSQGTDLIADVVGYFTTGSNLSAQVPARLLDTRQGYATVDHQFQGGGAIGTNQQLNLTVAGRGGLPASGVAAVVLNVTATNPTAVGGFITVWPTDRPQPYASNLNFVAGQTIANLVISGVSSTGQVSLFNSAGATDLIADVVGWFPANSELTALEPSRVLDTRPGMTTSDGNFAGSNSIASGGSLDLTVLGRGGVPTTGVGAVVLNVTVTDTSGSGNLRLWPTGTALPNASNLNYVPGQTVPNLVIAKVGAGGKVSIYNSGGTVQVVADVMGWFPTAPQ